MAANPTDPYLGAVSLLAPMAGGKTADRSLFMTAISWPNTAGDFPSNFGAPRQGRAFAANNVGWYGFAGNTHSRFMFGTLDFTIEFWVSTTTKGKVIVDHWVSSTTPSAWQVYIESTGALVWWTSSKIKTGNINIADGSPHHVAVVRSAGYLMFFVDGIQDGVPLAYSADLATNVAYLGIGAQLASRNATYDFIGSLADLRITKGLARYTTDFTPPGALEYFDWTDVNNAAPKQIEDVSSYAPYTPPAALAIKADLPTPVIANPGGTLFGGRGRIAGTVKEKGTPDAPVYRRVRLFNDRDGQCVAETWSDPATGVYVFEYINAALKYTVLSYDHTGQFRAVVADNLTPEIMP
jgi:hypothetical protein